MTGTHSDGGAAIGYLDSLRRGDLSALLSHYTIVFRRGILALTQVWCNSLMLRQSGGLEGDQAFRGRTSGALPA